jgi:hypothetical protein
MKIIETAVTEFRADQRRTTDQIHTLQQQHALALAQIHELTLLQEQTTLESTSHIQHLDGEVSRIQTTLQGVISMLQTIVAPLAPTAATDELGKAPPSTSPYPRKGQKRDV